MFGYLTADRSRLSEAQRQRYRSCYCGLCRAIGQRCGQVCRLCLTYDMVFLTMTLDSLYEPEAVTERRTCPVHPLRPVESCRSAAADYGADLNVLLAYYNCLDDWEDERRLLKAGEAKLLRAAAYAAGERNPVQRSAVAEGLAALREIEQRRDPSPDAGANAFGALMGSLFVWKRDRWEPELRALGEGLGRFIYLLDAARDRAADEKKGLYNPLSAAFRDGLDEAALLDALSGIMAEAAAAWDRLPLVQDAAILKNILYHGVWQNPGSGKNKEKSKE